MKNAEFVALVMANANKTRNIRTYAHKWFSGARRLKDCVLCKIGHVITLIQENVDEGKLINQGEEYLLIYNFQPLSCDVPELSALDTLYLTIDMMIRPMSRIEDTCTLDGKPMQLVVEAVSGEVMNNTKAMIEIGLLSIEELEDGDEPVSYGFFRDYKATCGFVILEAEAASIDPSRILEGSMDETPLVQESVAFDSILECREYLKSTAIKDPWIAELSAAKEDLPKVIRHGLSHYTTKLISLERTEVSPLPECKASEAKVGDQVHNLELARHEPPKEMHEEVPHPGCLLNTQGRQEACAEGGGGRR